MTTQWKTRVQGGKCSHKKPIAGRDNEDAAICRLTEGVIGVFDGIGSYAEARSASVIARQICSDQLAKIDRQQYPQLDDALVAVGQALLDAQRGVLELQQQHPDAGEGGTTATIAKLWQLSPATTAMALYANIGDSRLYHWHAKDRRLERLTQDDNMLREWREHGWLTEADVRLITDQIDTFTGVESLSAPAIEAWESRNTICAWLGMPDITFAFGAVEVYPGDRLIATSDGIHDNLTTTQMEQIISRRDIPVTEIARNLVEMAEAVAQQDTVRSKPDDVSAVAIEMLRTN